MKITRRMERWSPLVVLAAVLLLWQAVVMLFEIPEFIFPSPTQIAQQFGEYAGPLLQAAWKTFWVTMLGFALSIVVGVMLASRVAHIRLVIAAEAVLLGLRTRAFDHIHKLSLAEHSESRRGVLVSRVTSDVESLAQFTQWGAISWVINSSIITGALAVMLVYNWQLTLVVIACHLPLVPFLKWVQKRQFNAYSLVRTRVAETLGQTSEAVTGAPVIRAYGYDAAVRARLDDAIDNQYRSLPSIPSTLSGDFPSIHLYR